MVLIKNFSSPKIKIWFEPIVFPGSLAVLSGAAPPPFRIFAGGLPRRRRRRNAFGLSLIYCTISEIASQRKPPRFARRSVCTEFSGQKRIGDFERKKENFFNPNHMRYILYARKSTEEDDRQVLSIEAQLVELQEYAAKEKLEIVASFQEAKTAKEPGRTKFAEMLSFLETGKADGILAWHPDRLACNSIDGGQIIHLIDRGLIRSLKFPTFWFEPTPQGLFMLNIAFGQSKYFVDNLRENVKRGLRQKIRNGIWPGWAPVGYLNNPKTRGIDIDPEKSPKMRKLFELYATGKYPLHSLAKWCEKNNLKGNKNNKIAISNLQKNLQNIFYLGLMKWKGEIFEGNHEPIISKKLFDKCQEVMAKRGRVRPDKQHHFAFAGLMKCASCGCSITAQYAKGNGGIYTYYRCTKKRGACDERYISEAALTEQVKSFLQKVSLSSRDTKKVLAALEQDEAQAKEGAKTTVQNLKMELTEIETKLEKLLDAYLGEVISA
ncbi:recombinase family protein, partial [Candidatus Falkowbacteria bacterium]|nr:recombinase family protein [Candidatus Falkowbacteria bacterium]